MYRLFIVTALVVMAALIMSPAGSQNDVLQAWNEECCAFSFEAITPGTPLGTVTVGSYYVGNDYANDARGLNSAIQGNVQASAAPPIPEYDDDVAGYFDESEWYE